MTPRIMFFPRPARDFWIYHGSALATLTATQLLVVALWRNEKLFNGVASLLWIPLFTMGVLLFRYCYLRGDWQRFGIARLIPVVLVFALLMGAAISAAMLAMTAPFFMERIMRTPDVVASGVSAFDLLFQMFIGNSLQTQLVIAVWVFIYLSVTSARRMREAELGNLRLLNTLKEAQLSSLSNQLNPHFLFNALNNIRFMMHESADAADSMITALSEILRYSLESSKHEKVALRQERAIIDQYIAVVRTQLEQRLHYSMEIPAALEEILIPPMVLQMLVENAIKHGIDQLQEGGAVRVEVQEQGAQVRFCVSNDMPDAGAPGAAGTGIGLYNIGQRLRLLYGDRAALTIGPGEGTFTVTLTVPRELAP